MPKPFAWRWSCGYYTYFGNTISWSLFISLVMWVLWSHNNLYVIHWDKASYLNYKECNFRPLAPWWPQHLEPCTWTAPELHINAPWRTIEMPLIVANPSSFSMQLFLFPPQFVLHSSPQPFIFRGQLVFVLVIIVIMELWDIPNPNNEGYY